MIKTFRVLNPLNIGLLALVAVALRLGVIIQLPDHHDISLFEPHAALLLRLPGNLFSPFNSVLVAALIVLIQSIWLNRIVNEYNLFGKPGLLPALMYVTVTAIMAPLVVLSPVLLANFLLIAMISKFLSIYRRSEILDVLFDIGLMIGIGSLIYVPFLSLLPMLWIVLILMRPFNWREWLAGLTGFLTVYLFLLVTHYLNNSIPDLFSLVPVKLVLPEALKVDLYDYAAFLPVAVVLLLSMVIIRKRFYKSNVYMRKTYLLLLFISLLSLLSFFLRQDYRFYFFLLAAPTLSVFMAFYFSGASKRWLYESLYMLLVAGIVYFQLV